MIYFVKWELHITLLLLLVIFLFAKWIYTVPIVLKYDTVPIKFFLSTNKSFTIKWISEILEFFYENRYKLNIKIWKLK